MQSVDLSAPVELKEREVIRKKLAGLRAEGLVPAVIHNHGQDSLHVMAPKAELERLYQAAGKHHPLNLTVGSQQFLALIKDAHYNPVKRQLDHVVFQAIRQDEKVEAEVPIHIEGDIPAEKIGLEVHRQLDHIEIEALPRDLIDEVRIDGARLSELGDKITVADLSVPSAVTILTEMDHPIAVVVEPRVQAEEPEPETETEGEETEEGAEAATESGEGDKGPAAEGDDKTPAESESTK